MNPSFPRLAAHSNGYICRHSSGRGEGESVRQATVELQLLQGVVVGVIAGPGLTSVEPEWIEAAVQKIWVIREQGNRRKLNALVSFCR
jgi:hypothetical protein